MTEKETNSTRKGDFIDLEKGHYKKKTSAKKYFFFFIFLVIILSLTYIFFEKLNINNFFSNSQNEPIENYTKVPVIENKTSEINKEEIENLERRMTDLSNEIFESKLKISEYNSLILDLKKKIKTLESQKKVSSDFYYAEKYIVLNDLLNLKNKFHNRTNLDKELERLLSRYNDKTDIKAIIIYLQDIEIEKITNESDLLNRLNLKIEFYQRDLAELIDYQSASNPNLSAEIFQSKENFLNYFKDLFDSTFKITKINENYTKDKPKIFNESKLIRSLKTSKEYLILGDLNKSIEVLSQSYFNDISTQEWLRDAEILLKSKENIDLLEIKLLNIIGR